MKTKEIELRPYVESEYDTIAYAGRLYTEYRRPNKTLYRVAETPRCRTENRRLKQAEMYDDYD